MEELISQQKKEIKALDGEKRAAIKKAKSTKGKKAKDSITTVEEEYAQKLLDLEKRHLLEISQLEQTQQQQQQPNGNDNNATIPTIEESIKSVTIKDNNNNNNIEEEEKERKKKQEKLEKIRLKREKERQGILEKEQMVQKEIQENIGKSPREIEMKHISETYLIPNQLQISIIPADGNCLYHAIASQVQRQRRKRNNKKNMNNEVEEEITFQDMRNLCANTLLQYENELASFCDYETHNVTNFYDYVDQVRTQYDCWGGHVEIRALSIALQTKIIIYSSTQLPLIIDGTTTGTTSSSSSQEQQQLQQKDVVDDERNNDPILLSYHLHYYALGEHYNEVIQM